jgi:hypothetical protein
MAVSQFDPYRKDILLYKGAGMSPAEMIRALEADHGIEVKRSSFYLYCKTLFAEEGPQAAGGMHASALSPAIPEDELVSGVMQGAHGEMIERLVQLIEGSSRRGRKGTRGMPPSWTPFRRSPCTIRWTGTVASSKRSLTC